MVSALAALIAVAQLSTMNVALRPKSHVALTRAAVWLTIAFAGGLVFSDEKFVLVVESFAILSIAFALVVLGRETASLAEITGRQRVDSVTGLYNRSMFDERLFAEHSRTKRTGIGYAVAVFEIDNFRDLDDSDKLNGMKLLAKSLTESIRHTDTLARVGDEHIAVLMVDTAAEGGIVGIERARERFFFQSCGHDEQAHVTRPLTASVGVAAFGDHTAEGQDVVDNAEQALQLLRLAGESGIRIHQGADASIGAV
ncbi:MAG: GGDEF domain-containing protein [Solirubrobacterales bacterium]